MRTKFKQWAVDYLGEHPELVLEKNDFADDFFTKSKLAFEIGSGKGDFIVNIAKKNPKVHYLAIEKVKTVAGMMVKKIVDEQVSNVKVFANDASIIFNEIKDNFVDVIYLNFVDPWPKKKHAKRRLTFITFLNQYYRILKDDGLLIFKSDNDGLFEFSKEEITKTKFKVVAVEENYIFDEQNDVMTEYETKFRNLNQNIHRLILKK